jgi:hypothetical protein
MENNTEKQARPEQRPNVPSYDEYFSMNEREKDLAIERSVIRLQNSIRQIMYIMEIENNPTVKPAHARKPNDLPLHKK